MTKQVQLAGGTQTTEKPFVGLARELRVDVSNQSLRLHDGVKIGGYEFLNRDALNVLFQARSLELDGFSFGAQEKGLMVRVGPGQYRVRSLTANSGQFDVQHPRGTTSNFYFELLATITTAHTWSDVQTFGERIVAQDGLTGDTYGHHYGDSTGNAAGDHTGSFTGDVDIRGHDFLTDPGQITEDMIDPDVLINRGVPLGAILMWSGAIVDIPASWTLCDGNNGTPNLTNRFIVGAGGTYAPNDIGGNSAASANGATLEGGDHTHDLTIAGHALTIAELPAHTHSIPNGTGGGSSSGPEGGKGGSQYSVSSGSTGGGASHTHEGSTSVLGGAHTHDITLDMEIVKPPYYALCYIMKIV